MATVLARNSDSFTYQPNILPYGLYYDGRGFGIDSSYKLYDNRSLPYGVGVQTFDDELDALISREPNVSNSFGNTVRYTDGFTEIAELNPDAPPGVVLNGAAAEDILGIDFVVDGSGRLTAGTVNAFTMYGTTIWNVSIDAKRLFEAFVTPDRGDELLIVSELLAGSDTIYISDLSNHEGYFKALGGNDKVYGSGIDDVIFGGDGSDRLFGRSGSDDLLGELGVDTLFGAAGFDRLNGGGGNDRLNGGAGKDSLNGGLGADKFIYDVSSQGGDKVVGFDATDVFQFEGSKFSLGTYAGTLKAANFRSVATGHTAADANDYFIYDKKLDQLWFDADGKGSKAAVMIADLSNDFNLTAADILIV